MSVHAVSRECTFVEVDVADVAEEVDSELIGFGSGGGCVGGSCGCIGSAGSVVGFQF